MAQKVRVQINAGGRSFSGGEDTGRIGGENPFRSLRITQRTDWHHSFEIHLSLDHEAGDVGTGNQWLLENLRGLIGKKAEINITGSGSQYFKGIITGLAFERLPGNVREVVLRGESPTVLLEEGIYCRSFSKKKLKDIAGEVIAGAPANELEKEINPRHADQIPYGVQYKETSYRFLSRMADQFGEWFYYDGRKLVLGQPASSAALDLRLDRDLSGFELNVRVAPTKFKVKAYNYEKSETYEAASGMNIEDLDTLGRMVQDAANDLYATEAAYYTNQDMAGADELKDLVKRRKAAVTRDFVVATGTGDHPGVTLAGLISVDGYGQFRVVSVNHTVSGTGDYQNQFEAIPGSATFPPANRHLENPYCETQPAEVTDVNDPDGLGRVKVRFGWQEQSKGDESPWIRIANAHAAKERGFYFIPEVGDQVLVAFEHDNPLEPYVVGSVYHQAAPPKGNWMQNAADNDYKAIRTRSGNEIYFFDKQGKEEIRIFNRDGENEISLSLEGEGKIKIITKGKLEIKARSISMEAEEDIRIKSGKDTAMEARNVKVKAQQEYKLNGQEVNVTATNAAVKATSNLDLVGSTTAKLEAGADLTIKSGAAAKMQTGVTLDIDGGGMASMKAGIIKLN